MTVDMLTRQQVIERLQHGPHEAALAAWAFDQFYAAEDGRISYEPGYQQVIGTVLDDLMFSDRDEFRLLNDDIARLIARLEQATPQPDDDDEVWDDDDEVWDDDDDE
jgi:hypothetical protein